MLFPLYKSPVGKARNLVITKKTILEKTKIIIIFKIISIYFDEKLKKIILKGI